VVPFSAEVRDCVELYLHFHNTLSWHGTQLKEKAQGKLDDECSKLIHQRIQAKLQLLQNPSQINGDNLQFIERVVRLAVIVIEESPSYQLPTKFYPSFSWLG
jgi:hypothetical protein